MCGIVGVAGKINSQEREIFKDLLMICQLRGKDATGAICVNEQNEVSIAKAVGTPDNLLDTSSYNRNIDKYTSKVLVGHCRAKTLGSNTKNNAHPFQHGSITGVHNGTLRGNWRGLGDARGFEVDSDFLYHIINENGVEDTIPRLQGAYCLVWWDAETARLNFLRNDERPLWMCWSEDKQTMFWASEAWMLSAVSRRIKIAKFEDGASFRSLAEDELWSFEVDKKLPTNFKASIPKRLEGNKSVVPFTATNHGYRGHGTSTNSSPQTTGGSGVTSPFVSRTEDDITDVFPDKVLLPVPKTTTPQNTTSTNTASSQATNSSQNVSDFRTGRTPGLNSSRRILSLVPPTTQTSQSTNKNENSSSSHDSCEKRGHKFKTGVSFRTVAGLRYITDNRTGSEYDEHVFRVNTNGKCSWCKKDVPMADVSAFINPYRVLCNDCND